MQKSRLKFPYLLLDLLGLLGSFGQLALDVLYQHANGPGILPKDTSWRGQFTALYCPLDAGCMAVKKVGYAFLENDCTRL